MLEDVLRERIRQAGPLSFRDLMQAALYDPQHGYYTNLGRFDDFLTSPEVHPAFGWLLGRQVLDVWEALGRPQPLQVCEVGAGSGALAESLSLSVREQVPELEYVLDEPSPALRTAQQRRLRDPAFRWTASTRAHVVIANEVADALPVHRVAMRQGVLRELCVGLDARGNFTWVEADGVPSDVEAYFARLRLRPAEGSVAEVSTGLADWTRTLADRLGHGLLLVLDYGSVAEELFGRPQGTLLTYYRHTLGSDPLVRLGRQDISVHVDFSTLAMAARDAGLAVTGVTSQRSLLANLGLGQLASATRAPADRARLADLADPAGLGRIGALFATRSLPGYQPVGLHGGRVWPPAEHVPMLPPEPPDAAFLDQWREAFLPEDIAQYAD